MEVYHKILYVFWDSTQVQKEVVLDWILQPEKLGFNWNSFLAFKAWICVESRTGFWMVSAMEYSANYYPNVGLGLNNAVSNPLSAMKLTVWS